MMSEAATVVHRERVTAVLLAAHDELVRGFEELDGVGRFTTARWDRPGGGGGTARMLEGGRVFERAGVNLSVVHGDQVPATLLRQHPEAAGHAFFASGVSLVLHPRNPYVPAFHANFRYFETEPVRGGGTAGSDGPRYGDSSATEPTALWWFGGGADLTPSYPYAEDAVHFHHTLRTLCRRHTVADYEAWKAVCDDYFRIQHRHEARGVGGIFFDRITPPGSGDFEAQLAFVRDGLASLLPSYRPIVERRRDAPFGERERRWQLHRRGRYVEFNLVYDRGTLFGLQTQGNIEAILMSMPPMASWAFDLRPEPGSAEAEAAPFFQPRDWVGWERSRLEGRPGSVDPTEKKGP